jgi:energy-coupling factor transporter ATP-binding protein EcfA2/Holliday junction resolvase-like predicted endonuclease
MDALGSLARHTEAAGRRYLAPSSVLPRLAPELGPSVDAPTLVKPNVRGVIIGPPGAGKTTLLRALAALFARAFIKDRTVAVAPLLVPALQLSEGSGILAQAARLAARQIDRPNRESLFAAALAAGQIVLVVDAIDEVPLERRRSLLLDLADMARFHPSLPVLLGSRPAAMDIPFEGFEYWYLEPFNIDFIELSARSWFGRDGHIAEAFLHALKSNSALLVIAGLPLLLTLLQRIFETRGALPSNTPDVYADAVEHLLSDWDRAGAIRRPAEFTLSEKHAFLEYVALEFFKTGENDIERGRLENLVRESVRSVDRPSVDVRRIVAEFLSSGLLVERTRGRVAFVHRAFLDFYCARALVRAPDHVLAVVDKPQHHEMIVMACGLISDVGPIIEAAVERGEVLLAAKCISHGRTRNANLVAYVARRLLDEVGAPFAEQLRLTLSGQQLPVQIASEADTNLLRLWDRASEEALPSHVRGSRFEDFAVALFSGELFNVVRRDLNTENGELDLVCEMRRRDPFWADFGGDVLVECKNWSSDIPLAESATFAHKVSLARGVKLAFLLSKSGFTDHAIRMLRNSASDPAKPLIVPLDGRELKDALVKHVDLELFFKDAIRNMKYLRLH